MADLVERVEAAGRVASAGAARAEQERRLPDDVAAAIVASGVLRAWVPARYGGEEAGALEVLDAIEALAFHDGAAGWYDLSVRYFDTNDGVSRFRVTVAGQIVAEWSADDELPTTKVDAHSATRMRIRRLALRPGDEIRVEAVAGGSEAAAVDFVEVTPSQPR